MPRLREKPHLGNEFWCDDRGQWQTLGTESVTKIELSLLRDFRVGGQVLELGEVDPSFHTDVILGFAVRN